MNVNIDDGYKNLTINNDPNRVIRFNATDISIINRLDTGIKAIEKLARQNDNIDLLNDGNPVEKTEQNFQRVDKIDKSIREEVDKMLNTNAAEAIFGNQSTMSMVGGIHLWERALLAIIPLVKNEVLKQQKIRRTKIDKYVKQVRHDR